MTLKVCTLEYMLSTVDGFGMARHWFPRIAAEAFLESVKDGEIKRAPDPVTMIDGSLTYYNGTDDPQNLLMQIVRSPRTIVAQSPGTVVINDAWSWDKGISPNADYPSITHDSCGGKLQVDRPSAAPDDLLYGRFFEDIEGTQAWANTGVLKPGDTLHFRYLATVQTPGIWTTPTQFEPRWEAYARWTRLLCLATPI